MPTNPWIAGPEFQALVDRFVDGLPDWVSRARAAVETNRTEDLGSLAHQLKGAGGGFGFEQLTEPARRIERLACEGGSAASLVEAIESLALVCDAIVTERRAATAT